MNQPRVPADPTPTVAHGGTFVRPGALVWSRPDFAAGACSDSIVIEDALAAAAKDHDRITDLLDLLRRARLWLPLPDGGPVTDGSAVLLPTVTYLGAEFVPAFTSAERLSHWQQDDPRHIVVPAADLARLLPPEMGIALNPGAEASVPIYPEGISQLTAATLPPSCTAAGSSEVRVGHPPADPVTLLGEVRTALRTVPAVRRASRAWLTVPRRGEGLIISVTLDDPADAAARDAVMEAIQRAAALVPQEFPIDVTFPGEGAPDQVDEWIAACAEPFYVG